MLPAVLKNWFNQPPSGYRPGHTLACALDDLKCLCRPVTVATSHAVLAADDDSMVIEVQECIERHFQMHLVSLEMTMAVAARVQPGIRIDIRNTGLFFRRGIACSVPAGQRAAVAVLSGIISVDAALTRALMVLDFRRCRLESTEAGWVVRIEPFGGSEVVNRMPSFRRYIRLSSEQSQALLDTFRALKRLLTIEITKENQIDE